MAKTPEEQVLLEHLDPNVSIHAYIDTLNAMDHINMPHTEPSINEDGQEVILAWNAKYRGYMAMSGNRDIAKLTHDEFVRRYNEDPDDLDRYFHTEGHVYAFTQPKPIDKKSVKLPLGLFKIGRTPTGEAIITPHTQSPDAYIDLGGPAEEMVKEINWFLSSQKSYKDLGLAWRRGLLVYGPPGNGKSATIMEAAARFKDKARIFVTNDLAAAVQFRGLVGDAPSIVVIEEITEDFGQPGATQTILNFLDGVSSWTDCITIATTNYPAKLELNIVDRPSRFDRLFHVDNPNVKARVAYLSKHLTEEEITDYVIDATEGLSVAYLKELLVIHKLKGVPIHKVLEEFKSRRQVIKKAFQTSEDVGF